MLLALDKLCTDVLYSPILLRTILESTALPGFALRNHLSRITGHYCSKRRLPGLHNTYNLRDPVGGDVGAQGRYAQDRRCGVDTDDQGAV